MVWPKLNGKVWKSKRILKKMCVRKHRQLKLLHDLGAIESFQSKVQDKLMTTTEVTYSSLAHILKTPTDEICPEVERGHRPWIEGDTDCLELINRRREAKMKDFQGKEYRKLCKEVAKACRKAKRRWLRELCNEAENAVNKGDLRKVYSLVKRSAKGTW